MSLNRVVKTTSLIFVTKPKSKIHYAQLRSENWGQNASNRTQLLQFPVERNASNSTPSLTGPKKTYESRKIAKATKSKRRWGTSSKKIEKVKLMINTEKNAQAQLVGKMGSDVSKINQIQ